MPPSAAAIPEPFSGNAARQLMLANGLVRFVQKTAEILFRLICCERKTLFRLEKQAENDDYKRSEQSHYNALIFQVD